VDFHALVPGFAHVRTRFGRRRHLATQPSSHLLQRRFPGTSGGPAEAKPLRHFFPSRCGSHNCVSIPRVDKEVSNSAVRLLQPHIPAIRAPIFSRGFPLAAVCCPAQRRATTARRHPPRKPRAKRCSDRFPLTAFRRHVTRPLAPAFFRKCVQLPPPIRPLEHCGGTARHAVPLPILKNRGSRARGSTSTPPPTECPARFRANHPMKPLARQATIYRRNPCPGQLRDFAAPATLTTSNARAWQ